ncbi:MAG: ATP synthase F1 subunit gamma [Bacteroidales bacterium]|nr:ATP synthase F1 subunit gamma [Bacteroidales bacterium]
MSTLREVKDRIASVRGTLKITSAMKLVASSKLRKAQRAIEALRPYEEALLKILSEVASGSVCKGKTGEGKTVILAFSSNSSMCGAFNNNLIKKLKDAIEDAGGPLEVWAFGKKVAEAMKKAGSPAARDYSHLMAQPEFNPAAAISAELRQFFDDGAVSRVLLVYNHFVSTSRQEVVVEPFLGEERSFAPAQDDRGAPDPTSVILSEAKNLSSEEYILEPSREELMETLLPQVLDLKLYGALLDSAAAEHAARMIAMQAATDNAESLLAELTLEYNKGRQQKITAEILDLVGGAAR